MLHIVKASALRIALGAMLCVLIRARIVLVFGILHVFGVIRGTMLFISVCGPCVRRQQTQADRRKDNYETT
jgi:hypothetical protein